MTKIVMMPKELTAENGAKALLMGEFHEEVVMSCDECDGEGLDGEGDTCTYCNGDGCHTMRMPVSWTTIKAIYAKAVQHLAT